MRALTSVLVAVCLVLIGCYRQGVRGSGTAKSEQRTLGDFRSVEIAGAFSVTIESGEIARATVSGDDNIVPLVKTEMRDGRLLVYAEQDLDPRTDLSLDIVTPNLQSVSSSGASWVQIKRVEGDQLTLALSGTGSMKADGAVHNANLVITGAGIISTENLHAKDVRITVSGAGKADVFASDTLDVTLSGAGSVNYYGNPREVKKSINGVGFVTKK